MTGQGVGVAAGVARLDVGERRLGHQRPEADVLGLLLEERELLVGDRELGADALEPFAHVDEASLEDGLRHDRSLGASSLVARRCLARFKGSPPDADNRSRASGGGHLREDG